MTAIIALGSIVGSGNVYYGNDILDEYSNDRDFHLLYVPDALSKPEAEGDHVTFRGKRSSWYDFV